MKDRSLPDRLDVHHHFDPSGPIGEIICLLKTIYLQGERIMSAIETFADKMTAHNAKVDAAVDGLTADVAALNKQIADLQASAGTITASDQALLDGIEAKAAGVSEKLAALDALTPPVAPPVTP